MSLALALFLAMVLDAALGEPEVIWRRVPHPAVLMGKAVSWADEMFNHGSGRIQAGVFALALLAIGAALLGWILSLFGGVVSVLVAAILLAQRSLAEHVTQVADGLTLSPEDGRKKVAMIVGRDTGDMREADVARAAIESGAENFSDGVIAPAFWFLIAGLPGLLVYKVVNTADSMIGYRTETYEEFGKAAARLDDVMNWVPARISALVLLGIGFTRARARAVLRDAPLHRSPNAGWPEAAMAQRIGVALSGPRRYEGALKDYPFVNEDGAREIGADEIDASVSVLWQGWGLALAVIGLIALI